MEPWGDGKAGYISSSKSGYCSGEKGFCSSLKGGIEAVGGCIGLSNRATSDGLSEAKSAFVDMGEADLAIGAGEPIVSPPKRLLLTAESSSSVETFDPWGLRDASVIER